ncbi:MAG: beta-N-acetylhexosaminidase [Candidatus Aquirickettsiella sp.]
MGPIILDLAGLELTSEEREIIKHPQVGGIIFFQRNFASPSQLENLISQIHLHSKQRLLLSVDQEGGRVQRFQEGFTRLPALGLIGIRYDQSPDEAIQLAETHGWLLASELLAVGVDLSFAPVLDLNNNLNQVIGLRALHSNPDIVTKLGRAVITGMNRAGMCSVAKHFPGHGSVSADTHTHFTVDDRDFQTIEAQDLIPFAQLSPYLDGIMASHIVYNKIDPLPCGFSSYWLQSILRKQLNFTGAIFTDDLSMKAVQHVGAISERIRLALQAGCDGLLICNCRKDAILALENLERFPELIKLYNSQHLQKLFPRRTLTLSALQQTVAWRSAVNLLKPLFEH